MENFSVLNPNLSKPFISKNGTKWYVQFWYKNSLNERQKFKKAYKLNKDRFLKKIKGVEVEINKGERKLYAAILISELKEQMETLIFDEVTKKFHNPDKSFRSLNSLLEDFVEYNPRRKRVEKTKLLYKSYNNVIIKYFTDLGKPNITLNEVTRELIIDFLNSIEQRGLTSHRDNYLRHFKGFFKYCVDYLEIIPKSPIKLLNEINANDSKSNKAYEKELFAKVLTEAKNIDVYFWLLWRMVFYTLRRPSEILKLKYKDFNFEKLTINFDAENIKTHKKLYALLPEILHKDFMILMPNNPRPDDYLFGNSGKFKNTIKKELFGPIKTPYAHFSDKFDLLKKRLNLEDGYTLYSMKHTGIVFMIEDLKWSDEKIIQYTGHTNTLILGRYARDAKRERMVHPGTI